MSEPNRTTWVDQHGQAWRIEHLAGRWQLARWDASAQRWDRVGSYASRSAAAEAATESKR